MIATLSALLLAGAALPAPERAAIDARVAEIFAPYRRAEADATPPWERPIYSAELAALIARWQRVVPEDEPDALNDGDWLCQCQDFDHRAFRAVTLSIRAAGLGRAEVRMRVELGHGAPRAARLVLRQERGGWVIDDFFGSDFPTGLKRKLRDTIAEDEALRARAR